jgi:hypothetical protein
MTRLDVRVNALIAIRKEGCRGVQNRGRDRLSGQPCSTGSSATIIDLPEAGQQPMTDVQPSLTIVFSCCVDNHHELRREPSDRSTFWSSRDTQVRLTVYDSSGKSICIPTSEDRRRSAS